MFPQATTGTVTMNAARGLGEIQQVGHIPQAMQETDKLLVLLNDEIGVLENRIAGVLRPTPPQGNTGSGQPPAPVISQFAEGLNGFNLRLNGAIQRVREIAARADL